MRKLIIFAVALILAACAYGQDVMVPVTISQVCSNSTPTSDSTNMSGRVTGYVSYLQIDITTSYASPTCTVYVATVADVKGQARVIFTNATITADGIYPIRDTAANTSGTDISNSHAPIPLIHDRIYTAAYNANTNDAIAVKVSLYVDRK